MGAGLNSVVNSADTTTAKQILPGYTGTSATGGMAAPATSSATPVQNSPYGYGNFPLQQGGGGTNYNAALQIQSGDSDYTKAAKTQAQGNLATAQAAATANRVNQINPYGSVQYYQSGTDASGNPIWSSASTLAPEQQQLLNLQNQQSLALGNVGTQMLGNIANTYSQPFNPQAGAIQQGLDYQGMQGWDKASQLVNQRLQPQIRQQQEAMDVKLAQQGVVPGTEAYNRAQMQLAQQQNDLRTQAEIAAQGVQQNLFGQSLQGGQFANQAQQQAYNQALQNYNLPLQTLNSLRQGSQVQNPSFMGVNQQATTAGPDTLAAYQAQQQAEIARQNQQAAQSSNLQSGLFGLGGSLITGLSNTAGGLLGGVGNVVSSAGNAISNAVSGLGKMFSDIQMKENVTQVGKTPAGLGIYEFEYKPEYKDMAGHGKQIGVMAQEVEQVIPDAVSVANNGFKMVDYGKVK